MSLRLLTAGESHGPGLTAIIEGLPGGLSLKAEDINLDLRRRQGGYGRGGRMSIERDAAQITAGVIAGQTTGAPVAIFIENRDWANWCGRSVPAWSVPRPGHADLAGRAKYTCRTCGDCRAGQRAARPRRAWRRGRCASSSSAGCGITVGSHVVQLGRVIAAIPDRPLADLWALAESSDVRCPDPIAAEAMRRHIDEARSAGDSLGGVFVVAAEGLPVGLGSHVHWDRRLDGRLAQAILSIPAVKGLEIGPAFENAGLPGTEVQDALILARPGAGRCAAPTAQGVSRAGSPTASLS